MSCPDSAQLEGLVEDRLPAADAANLAEHLRSCSLCQQRVKDRSRQTSALTAASELSDLLADPTQLSPPRHSGTGENDPTARLTDAVAGPSGLPMVPGYDVVALLGQGGMGVVYKARQHGLMRWVALKMIQGHARPRPEELARFRQEALAIARLRHPNIIQIHEVGEWQSPQGAWLPFFCMELAAGGSLDRVAARRPQQPRWAAGLVHTLALAIDSAHRAGLVHRDLKPANVLIASESPEAAAQALGTTSFQGAELLRITDFGLALRTDNSPGVTRTGEVIGTPSYMAPEQAAGDRGRVGPATDVYALGAMLYELLVGRAPFVAATGVETILQVLHHDPLPPRRLQPTVPVDLETICMKCLEKEPRRRYPSAAALATDLDHYLKGEPIRARPISVWSRGSKWVRRNPALAGLAAALVLVVLGSFVTLAALYSQAEEARQRQEELALIAQRDRDEAVRANGAFERANDGTQAIVDFFFKDLLGAARPDRPGGRASVTLLEALDRAEAGMAARFQGRPGFEGSVRHALGAAYFALNQASKALRQFQRDLELRGQGDTAEDRRLRARILDNIGQCQLRLGDMTAARAAFQEAYDLAVQLGGADHPETVRHLESLAGLALIMGDLAAAEAGFRQVIAALSRHRSDDHPEMLTAWLNLATTLSERGRYAEAERLARQVLTQREARLGTTHPDVHETRDVIAVLLMRQRRLDELIPWLKTTLERDQQAFGTDDPRVESDRLRLAAALADAGKFSAAEELLRDLLARRSPRLTADHPDLAAYRSLLGDVLTCTGRAGAAEPMIRDALRVREHVLGKDQALTVITRGYLGHCLAEQSRFAEAEPLLLAAWESLVRSPGHAPHRLADLKDRLARLYESWGRSEEARRWRDLPLPTPP